MDYHHLFEPGKIGSLSVKNRVVMPPMGTNLASAEGEITDHLIRYYEERAKGGVGLIIVEVTSVEYELGKAVTSQPRADHNKYIPGIHRLANAVQKYDSKIFMQLHHAGSKSNSMLTEGKQIVAPSAVTCPAVGEEPRELTNEEVKELVNKFVLAAVRCKAAGIDGVELHGAHGYLINQFLSPYTNLRTDEYGGSFENRMRFIEEIIVGIRKTCGEEYPLIVRISADEFVEGGIDLELGIKMSKYLEKLGVDAIHVSAANYDSMDKVIEPASYKQGWRVYLAEEVKKEVKIPVIAVGVIREAEFADSVIREGKADFVAIGRGLIADPEWAIKAEEGRDQEIRKCISCLHCTTTLFSGCHVNCTVNVRMGRELEFESFQRTKNRRRVAVIGGGPAGMEAARVLTLKGYIVTVFEKEVQLGGQLNLANKPLHKEKINWILDYLKNEMVRLEIDIQLNYEATVDEISALDPYAVFIATGSHNFIPDIVGTHLPNVHGYEEVLLDKVEFSNKSIAVVGAGMTGCETAELLATKGNSVTLIDMSPVIGNGIAPTTRFDLLKHLTNVEVDMMPNHKLLSISPTAIVVEHTESAELVSLDVDHVIMALGTRSYNPLEARFKEQLRNVFVLGDAKSPGQIAQAIKDGFEKAYIIESIVVDSGKPIIHV